MDSAQFTQNDFNLIHSSWIALMNRHTTHESLAAAVALAFYRESGRNLPPALILSLFAPVPSGAPTSTTPHPNPQPPISFGHFNPPDPYRPASPAIDPSLLLPSTLQHHQVVSVPAPVPAQVPQYPLALVPMASRESSVAPVKAAPRKGKGKEMPISVDAVETQSTSVSVSRRKNAFLAIAKQPKALWHNRSKHTRVISLAVLRSDASDDVKAAANKTYDESKFEDLTPSDQGLWEQLAKLVAKVESTYAQISSVERNSLVHSEFSYLHLSAFNAFGIVPLTINFIPPHGVMPSQADFLITPPPSQRRSYLHWLAAEHPALYKSFRDSTQAYALYLFGANKSEQTEVFDLSDDEESAGSDSELSIVEIQNPAPKHDDIRDGIRIFEGLMEKKPFVLEARKHYAALIADRFKAAGYKHKSVDWAGIARHYKTWVEESAVPIVEDTTGPVSQIRPAKLVQANQLNRLDLLAWLTFFSQAQDPQCAEVTWEKGLLFRPSVLVSAQQVFADDDTDIDNAPASTSTPVPSTSAAATATTTITTTDVPTDTPNAATDPAPEPSPNDMPEPGPNDMPEPGPNDSAAPGTESTATTANPTTLPAPAANNFAPAPAPATTTPVPNLRHVGFDLPTPDTDTAPSGNSVPDAVHDPAANNEPTEDAGSDKLSDAPEPEVKKKKGRSAKAKTSKSAKVAPPNPPRTSGRNKRKAGEAPDLDTIERNASAGKRRR